MRKCRIPIQNSTESSITSQGNVPGSDLEQNCEAGVPTTDLMAENGEGGVLGSGG